MDRSGVISLRCAIFPQENLAEAPLTKVIKGKKLLASSQ